jgi:hypothetical protein
MALTPGWLFGEDPGDVLGARVALVRPRLGGVRLGIHEAWKRRQKFFAPGQDGTGSRLRQQRLVGPRPILVIH